MTAVDYLDAHKLRKEILAVFLRDISYEVYVMNVPVVSIPVQTLIE